MYSSHRIQVVFHFAGIRRGCLVSGFWLPPRPLLVVEDLLMEVGKRSQPIFFPFLRHLYIYPVHINSRYTLQFLFLSVLKSLYLLYCPFFVSVQTLDILVYQVLYWRALTMFPRCITHLRCVFTISCTV